MEPEHQKDIVLSRITVTADSITHPFLTAIARELRVVDGLPSPSSPEFCRYVAAAVRDVVNHFYKRSLGLAGNNPPLWPLRVQITTSAFVEILATMRRVDLTRFDEKPQEPSRNIADQTIN